MTAATGFDVVRARLRELHQSRRLSVHGPAGPRGAPAHRLDTCRGASQNGQDLEARDGHGLGRHAGRALHRQRRRDPAPRHRHGHRRALSPRRPRRGPGRRLSGHPRVHATAHAPEKFAAVGRIFDPRLGEKKGIRAAEGASAAVQKFIKRIGMGLRLRDLKVPRAELEALARQSLVLPDFKNHPRLATLADVEAILDRSH
ncbi:MAG: hypothetical protein M0C28_40075 [Candidatus Moduliflexus flocculans]|nr:hypothetical protein [Candidatus Moduliflexus flocculans]